jgi:alpha-N-arabinofuranosidase
MGPLIFVGEWATLDGEPTTNFNAALGDAAWMTGMERNSDLVIMSCYAPLLVNINPGGRQTRYNLIGYDALHAYGSPSYYAQALFSNHLGNRIVTVSAEHTPVRFERVSKWDAATRAIDGLFYTASLDTITGKLFIKIVNCLANAQPVDFRINGKAKLARTAKKWVLQAEDPLTTNSQKDPTHIVPIESKLTSINKRFRETVPGYSITVLELTSTPK